MLVPGGDGREAFRAMRTLVNGNGLPVIMMCAGVESHALDLKITAFLRKPLDVDQLLALIARLLADRYGCEPRTVPTTGLKTL